MLLSQRGGGGLLFGSFSVTRADSFFFTKGFVDRGIRKKTQKLSSFDKMEKELMALVPGLSNKDMSDSLSVYFEPFSKSQGEKGNKRKKTFSQEMNNYLL